MKNLNPVLYPLAFRKVLSKFGRDRHMKMQSFTNTVYKCCKTKTFIHYVCVKCHSVYHKSCVPKFKKEIRFIKQNKIVCCDEDLNFRELDEERSLLEKTLNELTEDSLLKNRHIEKLRAENKIFLEEALIREEEMNELAEKREEIINDLKQHIAELEKTITDKTKTLNSIGTQTTKNLKSVSTFTTLNAIETNVIVQKHIVINVETEPRCNMPAAFSENKYVDEVEVFCRM